MVSVVKRFLLIVWFVCIAPAAQAATCYTTFEAEAEQGIRIHSELMVIGLNCQHLYTIKGRNLYEYYRSFTRKQSAMIEMYENSLMAYYQRAGHKNPEAVLTEMRTDVANTISRSVANMRPDIFCTKYSPRVFTASGMSVRDYRRWATTFHRDHPVSKRMCR